ncbi:MAG TPA: hypothetical protein VMV10_21125 [Pirellulales bacterium]|nr:hypothetical protein [Pirellulales bacterium]
MDDDQVEKDPSKPPSRILGISKDTWVLLAQLAALLALAVALVGLQSLQ